MTDLKTWLEDTENKIRQSIEENRKFNCYITEIYRDSEDFYVWHKEKENEVREDRGDRYTIIFPYKTEDRKPNIINKNYSGNWLDYANKRAYVDLNSISHEIINTEEKNILDGFMDGKGTEEITINNNMYKQLYDSKEIDYYSKIVLLVNPLMIQGLVNTKIFIPYWKFPLEHYENKKRTYRGNIGDIEVHGHAMLEQNVGFIFDQEYAKVKMSKLTVKFNDYTKPINLQINERLISWISHPKTCKILTFVS